MRRLIKGQAWIWSLLLLWNAVFVPMSALAADLAAEGIQLEMRSTASVVDSGNKFTYELNYSVSSTTQPFTDANIVLPLPKELKFDSALDAGDTAYSYDALTHTVTFHFKQAIKAGTTGTLQVNAFFPNFVTPDGTSVKAQGQFQSGQGSKLSNTVTVTSRASVEWQLTKERSRPVKEVLPEPGGEVEYKLTLRDIKTSASGRLELHNVVLQDSLPQGAQLISTRPTADLVEGSRITWRLGTFGESVSSKDVWVKVKYPSDISGEVTNAATATFTPLNKPEMTLNAQTSHRFTNQPEHAESGFLKWVHDRQKEVSPGQEVNFYIGNLYSRSNVELQNYELIDRTPDHLTLLQMFTPTFTGIAAYTVQYSVTDSVYGPWIPWKTVRADQRQTLKVSDVPVSGVEVKGFKMVFGNVPVDFSQSGNFEIRYKLDPNLSVPVTPDENVKITNTALLKYTFEGKPYEESRSASLYAVQNRPLVEVIKKTVNGTNFIPGDTVKYRISVRNTEFSSKDLTNPIIEDLLPSALEYVPDSAILLQDSGLQLPLPKLEQLTDGATGRTLLRWSWNDANPAVLGVNKTVELEFQAKIKAGTSTGYIDNVAEVTSEQDVYLNNADFVKKIYKGGKWYLYNNAPIYVNSAVKLESVKWVQGDLDGNTWTQYPNKGVTTPGGKVEYKLQVTNVGNIPVKSLMLVDALPRVGDKGVVDSSPRDSSWSPVLTSKLTTENYVTVYYTSDTSISMSGGHWSSEPPQDLTTVTGLKFVFSDQHVIAPGAQEELRWVMRAPVQAPADGQAAWNSFGYTAKRADNGKSLLTTEPLKVGMVVQEDDNGEIGNYVWRDRNEDGIQNEPPELGVNGIPVELYNASGTKVQSTITGNDYHGNPGYYLFTNLTAGTYKVKFILPEGYEGWVTPNRAEDTVDSDPNAEGWTEDIRLRAGEKNDTVDAGLLPPKGSIGDKVWLDANGNGSQDPAEAGKDGVTVDLFDSHGFLLASTLTSNGGSYAFNGLPQGEYEVRFQLPAGYAFTKQGDGSQSETDSDADASGKTNPVLLHWKESITTIDAGLIEPKASIGNRVWIDENKDGKQDAGEPGLNGVTVRLLNESGAEVQTTSTVQDTVYGDGYYLFDKLWPGTYSVQFILPGSSYRFTAQGADPLSDTDSNADPVSGKSELLMLGQGEANPTIDAGLTRVQQPPAPASLGDYVWIDENGDGIQNDGNTGLNGVVVKLYDSSGLLRGSTVTSSVYQSVYNSVYHSVYSSSGYYQFLNLLPGDYTVSFESPAGYTFTQKGEGSDSANDSDAHADGITDLIRLAAGQTNLTVDAGLKRTSNPPGNGSLGDYVWIDENGDGVQNGAEAGLNGVPVRLYNDTGQLFGSTVTGAVYGSNGYYEFGDLSQGTYKVRFELPSGYAFTVKAAGDNRSADSDADASGWTEEILLAAGQNNSSIDAGVKKLAEHPQDRATLGDRVWIDSNNDGVQNDGEPGVKGLFVHLLSEDGRQLASTVTGSVYGKEGIYSFGQLDPGKYTVQFELPSGYEFTTPYQGADRSADSDASADGRSGSIQLTAGETNLTIDAGLIPTDDGGGGPGPEKPNARLGDFVWIDTNADGMQNEEEPGMNGVLVTLLSADGIPITSTVSGAVYGQPGYYSFDNLQAGKYIVKFDLPSGYLFTLTGAGPDKQKDSNASAEGRTDVIQLAAGEINLGVDAGLRIRKHDSGSGSGGSGGSGDPGGSGGGSSPGSPPTGGGEQPGQENQPGTHKPGNPDPAQQPGGEQPTRDPNKEEAPGNVPSQVPSSGSDNGQGGGGEEAPTGSPEQADEMHSKGSLPLTGESLPLIPFVGIALCAAAVLLAAKGKRKRS